MKEMKQLGVKVTCLLYVNLSRNSKINAALLKPLFIKSKVNYFVYVHLSKHLVRKQSLNLPHALPFRRFVSVSVWRNLPPGNWHCCPENRQSIGFI